jgi:hypothetical protein
VVLGVDFKSASNQHICVGQISESSQAPPPGPP